MKTHEAEKLIETIRGFVDQPSTRLDVQGTNGSKASVETVSPAALRNAARQVGADEVRTMIEQQDARAFTLDEEALYQRFRARFIDDAKIDPVLLHLILDQPEIIVEYERTAERLDGSTLRGRIAKLIARGFFTERRTNSAVDKELGKTGPRPNSGGLSTTIAALVTAGYLTRNDDGFQQAPGLKITEREIETTK